jgi:phospholipid N-methyltransferase
LLLIFVALFDMNRIDFLSQFLDPKEKVGAVTPSSKFLIRKMLKPIDFHTANLVIELGPGSGNITKEILSKIPKDAHLMIFEINEDFYNHLHKIKDPRLEIINDSAEHIDKHIKKLHLPQADYIISSLPLGVIPKKIVEKITSASYNALKKGGKFIQFQYSLMEYKHLREKFKEVKLNFTALNIPPAFIYECIK